MNIQIKRCESYQGNLPSYASNGAAGMDLYAAITENIIIPAGRITIVPSGIAIALPRGYECQVRSRSGLAAKHGIFALNAPGTIDSDYRGEIKVILANFGTDDYTIQPSERIAQIVIASYEHVQWHEVSELSETERGASGFGSTGKV